MKPDKARMTTDALGCWEWFCFATFNLSVLQWFYFHEEKKKLESKKIHNFFPKES